MAKWWDAAFTPMPACSTPKSIALAHAGERARGATLYLNLEPCSHQGRTPPCADAIIAAGVARVVAPHRGSQPAGRRRGLSHACRPPASRSRWPTEFAAEAAKLNEPFLHFMRTGRPLVTLKTAITLDGKISAPDDNRGWITSERARAHVQELRHDHDAILTGIGTVLADDCLLTDRTGFARCRPLLRLVMDSQLRLPLDSKMVRSAAGDVVAVTTSAASPDRRKALESRGVEVLVLDGPGGRADLAGRGRVVGPAALSVADDRSRQQAELDGARDRRGRSRSSSITGPRFWAAWRRCRWPAASAGGGAWTPSACTTSPFTPFRPTSSPSKVPGCSPGSLKSWAPWKRSNAAGRRAAEGALRHRDGGHDARAPASP